MNKIHHLSDHLIAKIAAGEVIERPAYAVKELIENSLDAGADEITILIEQSGLKKIQVIDNGEGMSRADVEKSWKTHTTSKISSEDQLVGIQSFGFRGEALASIASISTMTIKSRPKDELAGTQVMIHAGNHTSTVTVGMPPGTNIHIENLFSPVPARKKFLKSYQTEYRHILETVMRQALAFPHVHFILQHNGKIILNLPKRQEETDRIKLLLGDSIFSQFLEVHYQDSYASVSGFIARPQVTTQISQKYYIFVNNRPVQEKVIALAVKEAYGTMLEQTAYPVFVLFVTLPHDLVDINVHPRKEQISFINPQAIHELVHKAVSTTLSENNLTFHNVSWRDGSRESPGNTTTYAGALLKESVLPYDVLTLAKRKKSSDIIQMHNLYLVTQTQRGTLVIDQHAAHERVLYEQFKTTFLVQKKQKKSSILSHAIPLDLSPLETTALTEHLSTFTELGFQIEAFHQDSYAIHGLPELFKDRDPHLLIKDILSDLMNDRLPKEIDSQSQKMLAYLACRSAIMAGDPLSKQEMKQLIDELEQTPNNATCPHGRPTRIEMSLKELDRMFKRS